MRKLLNLVVLLAITGGAIYFTMTELAEDEQAASAIPEAGETLLPELFDRVNDVARIEGTYRGEQYELANSDGTWTLPSKADYPADGSLVRQLLIGLAGLETVEPKTSKPERYAAVGLVDPSDAESDAVRFVGRNEDGEALFDIVLGKRDFSPGDAARSDIYVRVGKAPQSWLVTGKVPEETGADEWIDSTLADIDRVRVASFAITHADGEVVSAVRDSAEDTDFRYAELPEGAELDQQWRIDDIGRSLTDLQFDDVAPASEPLEGAAPHFTAVVRTFDGLQVDMDAEAVETDLYVTLVASAYEPPEAGEDMDSAELDKDKANDGTDGAINVADDIERLNARWNGWRYKLPGYKAGHLANRQADLVKAPEPVEETAGDAESLGLPEVFDLQNPAASQN